MTKLKRLYEKRSEIKAAALWLYEQAKEVRLYILAFFGLSLLSVLFSLASPVASKYVVDSAIGANGREFQPIYALLMFGTTLFSALLGAVSNVFSSYVNEKFSFSVRARMFDRTQRGKWKNMSGFHSGDMLSRLTDDVDTVASNIISILPNLLILALQLTVILVILLIYDPVLALIGLVIGPVGMVLSLFFRQPFQKYQGAIRKSQSEYYTFFQETLGHLDVIKAFQREDPNNRYFSDFRAKRMRVVMKSTKLSTLMSLVIRLVYSLGYVIAFCWCASQVNSSPMYTYGTMTMFLSLVSQLQGSISGMGNMIPRLFSVMISAKRVREITEQEPEELSDRSDAPDRVGLSVKNVSFAYEDGVILRDVNFEVAPFERVGIVGPSGAGKTTLIRLMLALVSPNEGTVTFLPEGYPEEPISSASRRLLSYVPQGNTLITGTVRENLLIGDPDADDDAMWRALERADAAGFVRNDPRGLDLPIHENSGGLSAGQAQRLCIARALIRNRPVLILDEATSALDEPTERRVFEALSEEAERTCFIITHRSSMLRYCTSVLEVQDDGTVQYRKL